MALDRQRWWRASSLVDSTAARRRGPLPGEPDGPCIRDPDDQDDDDEGKLGIDLLRMTGYDQDQDDGNRDERLEVNFHSLIDFA